MTTKTTEKEYHLARERNGETLYSTYSTPSRWTNNIKKATYFTLKNRPKQLVEIGQAFFVEVDPEVDFED